MARSSHWPPRVYLHKKSGQARIRVNGRDHYLGRYGSPEAQREYARIVSELAGRGQAGPARARVDGVGSFTVLEGVERFLAFADSHYSPRGEQTKHLAMALTVVTSLHGQLPLAGFGAAELREVQKAMADRGWCASTINRRIIAVRTAWRWLEDEARLVPPGTWSSLRVVKPILANHRLYREPPPRQRTTDLDKVRLVCRHLTDVMRSALLFQFWTGARTSEVRIMRAGDVDRSGEVWTYRPRQHKNDWRGHVRVIVIGPKAKAVLTPWLDACQGPNDYVFPPCPAKRRVSSGQRVEYPLDAYDRTRCYSLWGYDRAISRAAQAADVPGFHAYLCRHATRMRVSREGGDEAARSVLGQKHLGTTLGYGELDLGLAKEAARKIG